MKLLTFNCWHGLSGPGLIEMLELEPAAVRREREARQIQQLNEAQADIYFLQELNPLMLRLPSLVKALGGSHNGLAQHDLTGVKFLGQGFPTNLNSGLGIVARNTLDAKKLRGLKLSGMQGFNSSLLSLQLTESRYALLAEAQIAGVPTLLVNCHLHHGFPLRADILAELDRLQSIAVVNDSQRDEIIAALQSSDNQRRQELNVLTQAIAELSSHYSQIVVAGDFNTEPDETLLTEFLQVNGLVDVVAAKGSATGAGSASHMSDGALGAGHTSGGVSTLNNAAGDVVGNNGATMDTFDSIHNPEIFALTDKFELPVPNFGSPELKDLWTKVNLRPRRIDHVLCSANLAGRVTDVKIWGRYEDSRLNSSDHFGIMVELAP